MEPGTSPHNRLTISNLFFCERGFYLIIDTGTLFWRVFLRMRLSLSTLAVLAVAPVLATAQISLVHVTPCGPQIFPTSACTVPATGSGDLIVVGIQLGGGASTSTIIATVTDNAGNAYAEAGGARSVDTAGGSVADIWYARNSRAGATTITISPNSTFSNAGAVIWEFSGANTTAPLDGVGVLNSQASNATPAGAPVTTGAPSEVVVSLAGVAGSITGIMSGNNFVNDSNLKSNGWAHLITTSAGSFTPQWNQSPAGTFASSTASFTANGSAGAYSACDLNQDLAVNVIDVQLATNMNLGLRACNANIAGQGVCSPLVIQQITNTALGAPCTVASSHSVLLSWTASTTSGVNYNVYRSTTSGGPYTKLTTTTPVSGLSYIDGTVNAGQMYYYVTTAINSSGESAYSNEAPAAVPFP